jgi:hypothetical protein
MMRSSRLELEEGETVRLPSGRLATIVDVDRTTHATEVLVRAEDNNDVFRIRACHLRAFP